MKIGWLALLLTAQCASAAEHGAAPFAPARLEALITDSRLDEISGIAASRLADAVYWVHNDAPRPASLHAINGRGERIAQLIVEGVRAVDWEDVASFVKDGKSWLLIGDVGDNAGTRKDYELILIEEPDLQKSGGETLSRKPEWRMRFRYPDGAHDCEAIAIDMKAHQVLLLSKRSSTPAVYALPLAANTEQMQVARKLTELRTLPQPTASERQARFPSARLGSLPTAMDVDVESRRAIVLTYRDIWVFTRLKSESWMQAFARAPERMPLPPMAQAEALAFDRTGESVLVSGEHLPAPLLRFDGNDNSDRGN
ncbi:hypothetical protein [Dokdonella sp.]|uniref:hypothetical protein n=1 Tax=Dokdonella sp. TaxID=2291710 RepID=UPI0035284F86